MVAVIAGQGLGLDNSSLRSLGQGLGGQAIGQGGVVPYLNVATGNLTLQNADEGLIVDGLPLRALRTYNSQGQLTGNGGWLFGFSRAVGGLSGTRNAAGSTITRTGDDGSTVTYAYDASRGVYVSQGQSGAQDTLAWNATASTWTWTDDAASQQETYDASGQLTALSDTRSGAHYSFGYSGGQLHTITAGDGDTVTFGYTPAQQLSTLSISEIPPGQGTAVTRQQVSYTYDAQGRLSTVATLLASDTDASTASYTTTYTYDGTSDRVASVGQDDGTVVSYTYAADAQGTYRVATVTTGRGAAASTLTLQYDLGTDTTTLTDALGQAWTYTYDAAGQLSAVSAPSVDGSRPTTHYRYDADGNLQQVADAEGGITTYGYDARGNRLSVEDATGHTVGYTYNADDQVLSQTVYTVPAQGVPGQPGYVAPGGAQTTWYVYDASARLSYVVDPLGQVTGHDYTTSHGLTVLGSTRQYVGVVYDVTGLSPTAPPSLAALQGWVASTPVQATLGRSLRTDYTYDPLGRGQLATQTQWATLDSLGNGILDAGTTLTSYTYDAQGRLLQSGTQRGASRTTLETTRYAYDGLGRLISRTDPLNQVTHYVYTDSASGDTLAITQANGLVTTQVRNSAGQLVSSTSSASGQTPRVTSSLYDALGHNVATIDPAGQVSYTFYDADGRIAGTVDATGAVTALRHDADGHVIGTTQYATPVSTSGWVSAGVLTASFPGSLPLPTASADDRTTHTLVDAAGRAIATIDALGAVATVTYDGEGHAIATTAYATALTAAQLTALGSAPTWAALQARLSSSPQDRTAYTVYDADGRAAAGIDASGYVTTTAYDTAGRAVATTAYATALTAAQRTALGSTPGLPALQADLADRATNDHDQTTRRYDDGAGRLVAQVDADGYLTTMADDEATHVATTTRYATALTPAQLTALTGSESVAALVGLLGSTPASEVSQTTYDADNQVVSATAADGTVSTYTYNAAGQRLSTTVTPVAGQGTARTTASGYDAFGEVVGTLDGVGAAHLTAGMTAAQQAAVFAQYGTTYTYNALGQRASATDPLGNTTWTWYDADGRVAYTVQGQPGGSTRNAVGHATAYTYNTFGQVATARPYASQLTLTGGGGSGTTLNPATATLAQVSAAVAALPVSANDANGLTTYRYTLDGQLAGQTDGLGYQSATTYDAFGDRTQVQQQLRAPGSALSAANSTISTFTYDSRGEQTGETDGVGTAVARSASVTYDAFGRVTGRTDGDGHVVTVDYDRLGRQVSTRQVVGGATRATQTTYDAFDRVVTQADALGNLTTWQYDLAQHTTRVTTADGVTVTTVTDAYGDTVSVTDGAGNATTSTYDADGDVLTVADALGHVSTNQYDADGELTRTTDATGHVVTYRYDASGHVLARTVDPDGLALSTTYAYDGEGRQLSVTDPTGTVTTYAYDADGHVLTQVHDAGTGRLNLTTTYTYDGAGKTLTVTAGAGTAAARTTQYVYDNRERLSQQIVDPGTGHLHLTTRYAYDANDNLIGVTDANSHTTLYVYDEANAPLYTIDPRGAVTRYVYNAGGLVTEVCAYATALTAAQLTALGAAPTMAAVTADLTTNAADQRTYTAYNAQGQVRYRIDPSGNVTETRYDAAGRVSETLAYAQRISVTTSQGTSTAALTLIPSLLAAVGNTDATAEVTLRLYDADGRARFVVQQNTVDGQLVGIVSEQRYDGAGRVIASIAYGSTLPLSTTSALSAQLSTASVAQALASAPYQISQNVYDNAGRLRYTLDATNHIVETRYDDDGRVLEQLAYANAISVPATLTEATLAAAVTAAGTTGARLTGTQYDTAGRVHTTSDALGVNATYTYDATGLVTQQADRSGAVTVTTYDAAGRRTLVQSPSVTVGSYSGGTLQSAAQYLYTAYAYDGMGNVTAISQGAGTGAGAWTIQSTIGYAYDAAGHQTVTTYPATPDAASFTTVVTYNALGQAVVDKDGNGHYQYKVYDADGRVAYAVDADGYVTGTSHDAWGNVTAITRYATALSASLTNAGQPLTLAHMPQGTVAGDRTITTAYDQRHQKIQVQQPSISYELSVALAGTWTTGSPTTTYTYDSYGNVTSTATLIQGAYTSGSTASPVIWATIYTYYDAMNRAVMTIDPAGQYTAPQGYVTTTAYDAFGEVTARTQYATAIAMAGVSVTHAPAPPAANLYDRTTSYLYDGIGRTTRETDTGAVSSTSGIAAGSSVTQRTYDDAHRKVTTSVNGMATVTQYDAAGRVVSVTAPPRQALASNWQTLLATTPADDLTTAALYVTVSPVTTTLYDALGHALSTMVSAGDLSQQTRATYDALGRQTTATDAEGHVTTFHYDNNGHLTGQVETLTGNGAASTVTTTCTYDANGQQLSTAVQRSGQSGDDSYTQVKYNAFGEITDKGDNAGYEAHYSYNDAGQLTYAPDSKTGAMHTYGYDLAGHQVVDATTVTGGGTTTYTLNGRDLSGNVVQRHTPNTHAATGENATTIQYTYDRWGNVTTTTDAAGNVTHDRYDSQNHRIGETEPDVLVVSDTGVRTWATPTRTWYYNVNGQWLGTVDENGHTALNTYNEAGQLTVAQDATSAKTYTAYDALGRAVAQQLPSVNSGGGLGVTVQARITYTAYDDLDQVIAQGDFLLNAAGTARTKQAQQTYVLNSHGDRLQVTDALGNTAYYDYDSQHRVIKSQTPVQHAGGWSETMVYDVNGHKTKDTDANGVSQSWVYDYFGRVTSHVDLNGAATTYSYDAYSGLLTGITSHWTPTGQADPAYLAAGWNGTTSTQSYSYDADGQISDLTDAVDGTAMSEDTYAYDANGNTVSDIHAGTDGTGQPQTLTTLSTYDSHNRLSVVTTQDTASGTTESREAILYDAAGNRRAVFVQSAYGPTAAPISGNGGAPTVATVATQTAPAGHAWSLSVASHFTDNIGFGLTFAATQASGSALPGWMHFNSNGSFSGTPSTNGSWSVTVTATDVNGQSVSTTFTVTVPVAAPVFGGVTNPTGSVHGALNFTVPAATDANGSALTYSASLGSGAALPSWLSFNASTRAFTGTPPVGSIGSYALTVTATAANGGSASETFTLTVAPTPPVYVSGVGSQSIPATRAFSFGFAPGDFSEADGDALTFSAGTYSMSGGTEIDSALPGWMSFNAATLTFSGTPPISVENQSFTLYLKGTNPQGQAAEAHFTVTVVHYVQPAPVYHGTLPSRTGAIGGSSLNLTLPSGAFTEPDSGALTYSAMVLIPEHDLDYPVNGGTDVATRTIAAQWVALSTVGLGINATSGAITGVPTTLDYVTSTYGAGSTAHDSAYQIEIVATNAQGGTATGTFTLTNSYAPPAVQQALPNLSANPAAGAITAVPAGAFSDPYGHGLTYTATLSTGAALSGGLGWSGASIVVGTVASGSYTITVTAKDGLNRTVSANVTLTVSNAGPVFPTAPTNHTTAAGVAMTAYQAPAATDANGDAITYSASNLPAGISFNAATRTFSGTPTTLGTTTITYTATDIHGAATHATFTLTVTNAAPVFSAAPVNRSVMASVAMAAYQIPVATDANGDAITYSASGLPAGISFNATTRTFSGTPTTVGTYTVTCTATDSRGAATHASFILTVTPYIQPAPVYHGTLPARTGVIGGASLNLALPGGAFTESDGGALTYSAMVLIPEHDQDYPVNGGTDVATRTIAAQWVALSTVGLAINAGTGAITGVPTTLDYVTSTYGAGSTAHDSAYQIEIVATNAQGGTATGTFTLTNSYAPPAVQQALPNLSANPGKGALAAVPSGSFSDPYGHGLTYTATLSTGAALSGGLSWSGASVVVGTVASGSYALTVTAKDGLGHTASAGFTLTVSNAGPVFATAPTSHSAAAGVAMTAYQAPAATDANGDAITYSASNLPAGISFNATTRTFSGTPTTLGTTTITYTATDIHGAATHATFSLTVTNAAPVFSAAPVNRSVMASVAMTAYPIPAATDANHDAITYSASGLPAGISFNAATRTFSGTPTTLGTYTVTCTATDSRGAATHASFILTVTAYVQPVPVYHGSLTSRTGVIGASLSLALPSGAFTESDGGALSYTAMVLIPEHDLDYPVNGGTDVATRTIAAQWVALSQVGLAINATSGAITGVPTTLDYVTSTYGAGSSVHATAYQIEVIATNAQHGMATGTFTLSNSYAPPTQVTALANHSANPGAGGVAVVPAGAFTDPYGDTLTYTATLSTGAALPGGLSWSGTSIYVGAVSSGSYAIKVTAHGIGGTASATFTLTVANAAPVISGALSNRTAVQGTAMTAYQAPIATDANGDAITYSASGLPTGISFNASTRTFSGTPTATGAHTITYTATDSKGAHTSATFVLTVNAPAPTPPVYNGGIPAEIDFSYGQSNSYAFASHFTNPAGRALTYSLSGTALPVNFSFNTTTGVLSTSVLGNVRNDHNVGSFVLKATDAVDGLSVSVTFDLYLDGTGGGTQVVGGGPVQMIQEATQTEVQTEAQTEAQTETTTTTPNIQSYWFTYDADDRVAVFDGGLVDGQVMVTGDVNSYENVYDAAGNVSERLTLNADTQSSYYGTRYAGDTLGQRFTYDGRNELLSVGQVTDLTQNKGGVLGLQASYTYDADGHQLTENRYTYGWSIITAQPNANSGPVPINFLMSATATSYNADGNVTAQASYGRYALGWQSAVNTRFVNGDLPDETDGAADLDPTATVDGELTRGSITAYTGFDHAGNVTTYSYNQVAEPASNNSPAFGANYTVHYLKKDGYLEQSTTGTATLTGYLPATDTSYYDAWGRRTAISQSSEDATGTAKNATRIFAYDAAGEIVQRRSGTVSGSGSSATFTADGGQGTTHYAYVEGQQVGSVDENGGIHVLDTLTGFIDSESSQSYVVQSGDSLETIAQAVYGDSRYAYILADANGLDLDDTLVMGQAITLPSVTTSSNGANTFKPYNPGEITGSTTPSLPMMPQPPSLRCQTLSHVIAIAVTVVVGYYAGPAAGAAAGNLAGQYSSMMFNGQYDWGRAVQFAVNPLSGNASDFARSIYDPTGNGAPGKADYKSAAIAAAAAEAGSYAGSLAGDVGSVSNAVVDAGVQYTASVELGKAAGYDTSFSLRELGTTMATAYAAHEISQAVGAGPATYRDATTGATIREPQPFSWGLLVKQATADVLTQGANYVIRKGAGLSASWDWQDVGADAFGNALGNGIIGGIKTYQANQLPAIDATMDPMDVGTPVQPALTVGDISQSIAPVGPAQLSSYTVQSGDTLSGIAGTSDPATIGMLMYLNGMTNSTLDRGQHLISGDLSDYSPEQIAQFRGTGQRTLDDDNVALAAHADQSIGSEQAFHYGTLVPNSDGLLSAAYGTPVGNDGLYVDGASTDEPWANEPLDMESELSMGMGKGLLNLPSELFNAGQTIKGWINDLEGRSTPNAGPLVDNFTPDRPVAPTIPYANAYQQVGGFASGFVMLGVPGAGEAEGLTLLGEGSMFARGGASASEVWDISGGSFLVSDNASPLLNISDNAFVRFDPIKFDASIDDGGLQASFSGGKLWFTKYGDVKDITNATDLEQVLYRQNLWDSTEGKFTDGATLRLLTNVPDAVPAGLTNMTNGVRQWRVVRDIPPADLQTIMQLKGGN